MNQSATWKRWTVIAAVLVMGLAIASGARAASILSNLDSAGNVTHLEDNDWEYLVNNNGSGATTVDVGDFLIGMIEIQRVNHTSDAGTFTPVAGTDSTLTAVFALEVTSVTTFNGTTCLSAFCYTFGALDDAEYATTGLPARTSSDTVAIVYEDSSDPFVNPAALTQAAALATASEGTAVWELGLATGSDDFWVAALPTNDITSDLLTSAASGFGASISVTNYYAGAPLLDPNNFLFATNPGDVQLKGGFEPLTGGAEANFDAQTDTDLYIQVAAVPEPTSLILLGAGLLLLAPASRYISRSRKK